jgi:hypothetical protein
LQTPEQNTQAQILKQTFRAQPKHQYHQHSSQFAFDYLEPSKSFQASHSSQFPIPTPRTLDQQSELSYRMHYMPIRNIQRGVATENTVNLSSVSSNDANIGSGKSLNNNNNNNNNIGRYISETPI